jgi:hypothetical protein
MAYLDYEYFNRGESLRLIGRIGPAWVLHTKTYCYSELIRFGWKFGYELRAALSVFPRPGSKSADLRSFPEVDAIAGASKGVMFSLAQSVLQLELQFLKPPNELNRELPWTSKGNDTLCLEWIYDIFMFESRFYEVQMRIYFQEPPGRPAPILKDWERRFFPGGLPSLGKHRP